MNVLHISNNYPTARNPIFGIFVKEQIESLNKIGINNDVFFINGREKGKSEYLRSILTLRKKLRNNTYNIIHCHHALSALCLILSGRSKSNKVVVSFQNDPIDELGRWLYYWIKKHTCAWIFKNNSKFIGDEFSFYLPNGVNTKLFYPIDKIKARKKLELKFDKIYILFVSSNFIRKQKRYDRFNETIQILRDKYNYENIEEVKLINVQRDKIPLYFNAVDLHLLTSDFEGSPNSVKESLACNTPVVSTNVGNVAEIIDKLVGSYVSGDKNSAELARLVDQALKEGKTNGYDRIIELKLDINSVAFKLKDIYNKILLKR